MAKSKIFKLNLILIFSLLILSTFALVGCWGEKENISKPILGVWWWDDTLGDQYLNFAKDNNVTEIYYCSSKFDNTTDTFIKKANDRNMDVYFLTGDYSWIEDSTGLYNLMAKYQSYQSSHTHKFKGVHLDIEPHQSSEFKTNRTLLITKYIQLVKKLRSDFQDTYLEYDIPFWLHDEITMDDITKPAYEFLIDYSNRVTLMSYRDTAQGIYNVSKEEIEYAISKNKTVNLGVETKSDEGDQVSFMEEGKLEMYKQIDSLRKMIPNNFGVVIHQIKVWYDLKEK